MGMIMLGSLEDMVEEHDTVVFGVSWELPCYGHGYVAS